LKRERATPPPRQDHMMSEGRDPVDSESSGFPLPDAS
jgi:hypothetical protein